MMLSFFVDNRGRDIGSEVCDPYRTHRKFQGRRWPCVSISRNTFSLDRALLIVFGWSDVRTPTRTNQKRGRLNHRKCATLRPQRPASSAEPLVRESLARYRVHEAIEPRRCVASDVSLIQPEGELIDVAAQVLLAGVVVDAMQAALENRPDALNRIGGRCAPSVLPGAVVNRIVLVEQPVKIVERHMIVGVELRPNFHAAVNLAVDRVKRAVGDDLRPRPTAAFSHPQDRSLANATPPRVEFLVLVFVAFFSADETLVYFDNAGELREVIAAASLTETAQNEPRRFLRDSNLFGQLHRRDSLARSDQQIHGVNPLVKGNLRPLENRVSPNREIELTSRTAIETGLAGGTDTQSGNTRPRFAIRAYRAVRPESLFEVDPCRILVWKQLEKLKGADSGFRHLNRPAQFGRQIELELPLFRLIGLRNLNLGQVVTAISGCDHKIIAASLLGNCAQKIEQLLHRYSIAVTGSVYALNLGIDHSSHVSPSICFLMSL
jgi:hypothetical protein